MAPQARHRTLVVANRTAATPLLLDEVKRRAQERPTTFTLLIPNAPSGKHPDWELDSATELLGRAAKSKVKGLMGRGDPFESVQRALQEGEYDDVLISTLPRRTSEWLRRDLPHKVEKLGIPVAVISQREAGDRPAAEAVGAAGPIIMG
jgi:hypothetical protein